MDPVFFDTPADFRKWLGINHHFEKELWVGYYKAASNKKGMTYQQAVDEALCYGWIDGIIKTIDKDRYCNRFTPRRVTSIWSAINIKKVEVLIGQGRMQPAGLEIYKKRIEDKSQLYSYENKPEKLPEELELKLVANEKAWNYFKLQGTSYQRTAYFWVMSAKQEITRMKRLEKLIKSCEEGKNFYN